MLKLFDKNHAIKHFHLCKWILASLISLIFLTPIPKKNLFRFEQKKIRCKSPTFSQKKPLIFHFIWLGPNHFPIPSLNNIRSFKKKHPKARFILWSDVPLDPILDFMENKVLEEDTFILKEIYKKSTNVAQQSDIARLEILYQYGGIYCDHDALCKRALTDLYNHFDFIIGAERGAKNIGIGLILSIPRHPILHKCITNLSTLFHEKPHLIAGPNDKRAVINSTYTTINRTVKENLGEKDIVLPSIYFYPKKSPPIYSRHLYHSAWIPDYQYIKNDDANKLTKSNYILLKSIFLVIILSSLAFLKKAHPHLALLFLAPLLGSVEKNFHIPFFYQHTIQKKEIKSLLSLQEKFPQYKLYLYTNNQINTIHALSYTQIYVKNPFIDLLESLYQKGGYCIDPAINLKALPTNLNLNHDIWCYKGVLAHMPQHTKSVYYPILLAAKKGHPILAQAIAGIKAAKPQTYNHPSYQFYHKVILPLHKTFTHCGVKPYTQKLAFCQKPFVYPVPQEALNISNLRWMQKTNTIILYFFIYCFFLILFLVYKKAKQRYNNS